jgi:hypothetical protein
MKSAEKLSMRKKSAGNIVDKFNGLDLHDDGLRSVKVYSLDKRTNSANVDIEFLDDSTGAVKLLSFRGCGNLRYFMDFDVLANNWFAQTEKAISIRDLGRMQRFVRAQIPHWHVTYMPPSPKDKPIKKKLLSIRGYVLFRVTFFGGTIEVLARGFTLGRASKS